MSDPFVSVGVVEALAEAVNREFGDLTLWQDGLAGDDAGPYEIGLDELLTHVVQLLWVGTIRLAGHGR